VNPYQKHEAKNDLHAQEEKQSPIGTFEKQQQQKKNRKTQGKDSIGKC
jgi:hypothetical protein